ncbi:glycosyltransferase [Adlercreutzia sp. ZJ242]|uniref:glycosyltransferase family 2 protein n=1 Tax=Adlercreutzia sp. ZJ242 TaxID=2709409 RepID=UPI0013EE1728|nr:glycosyltransferase [Adlercreutzia sp. ZJ242]
MAETKPLISVVVPFYNIEGCVRYCMKSLLSQTFWDYEIVCIDDGSTDGTGKLLDGYGDLANVVVHHKENGGLSEARNYGVGVARGELVTFVDGDDIISPYYLEALESCYRECGGGMAIGQVLYISEDEAHNASIEWGIPATRLRIEKRDLIEKYAYEEILPAACCRLAPLELYKNRSFPSGAYYEEIATATGFVSDVDIVAVIEGPIYGYVMRPGSIVHRKRAQLKQVEDYIVAIDSFGDEAGWDKQDPARIYFECLHYSRIYRLLNVVADAGDETEEIRKAIVSQVRRSLASLLKDNRVSKGNKARFAILGLIPRAYSKAFEVYGKRRGFRRTASIGG